MSNEQRQQWSAEVIELGEALFDILIEAATTAPSEEREPLSEPETRAAAEQFFAALRLLLQSETP